MFTIYLCDDDAWLREHYSKIIQNTIQELGEVVTIREFSSGESLLFHLHDNPDEADIIYLDVIMGEINGINTAKELRRYGCTSEIIFLTSDQSFVFESFDVSPNNYLLKTSVTDKKFKQVLLSSMEKSKSKRNDFFVFKSSTVERRILTSDILYFEVVNRIVIIHCTRKTYEFYSTMKEIEEILKDNKYFLRVHRSFIINLRAINSINKTSVTLSNGEELPVGLTYIERLPQAYSAYLSNL